jgi:hypothetical protein
MEIHNNNNNIQRNMNILKNEYNDIYMNVNIIRE